MDILRPTYLQIHLDRLMKNFRFLRSLNPEGFLCPMIKANAYGHGDIAVAKALVKEDCQFLGVSSVEEGLHLRISEVGNSILAFGFHGREAVREMIQNNLTPVVSNFDQLSDLCHEIKQPIKIHIKMDTGMHRLGFQDFEIDGVLNVLAKNPLLQVEGFCTHLHSGDNISDGGLSSSQQLRLFRLASQKMRSDNLYFHAYNSAAIAGLYKSQGQFHYGFRPGLLAYGIDPQENLSMRPLVSPVMEFKSKIVATQNVKSGRVVSYGGTWTAPSDSVIGIVPAGYADGVCRSLSNKGEFLVNGQRVPIRGRVCMDYTMVDLSALKVSPEKLINQEVVLFGRQSDTELPLEEVSQQADRIHYEIMTGISERVPRFYGVQG